MTASADDPTPLPTAPLWPLPLIAGLLPAAASIVALTISVQQELVPACNPFVDGCVSISRGARHGVANTVFRAMVLPAAALQALTWIVATLWLRGVAGGGRGVAWLPALGVAAAVALALYGAFLGTEGAGYRLLRRYGTVVYFGATCLCLLVAGGAIDRAAAAGRLALPRAAGRGFVALAAALVTLGVVNAMVGAIVDDPLKDRVENIAEWWGSAIFVAGFVALAALWRQGRVHAAIGDDS